MKKIAFTLAETLIVMGIIGVVAALTLPNLNSSTGDKEKVAKVKKIYQNLEDALGRAQAVYGPYNEWFTNILNEEGATEKRIGQRLTEFMKISKDCGYNRSSCGENCIEHLNQDNNDCDFDEVYDTIVADGTRIGFSKKWIVVDIDGPNKGVNTFGKDIFEFTISNEGLIMPNGDITSCLNLGYCTKWVITNDNMDYLKADENGKCKNSNVTLSETVTSCK